MVVFGAGAIGVELASFYRSLGVEITIVEFLPRLVPNEDADISCASGGLERSSLPFLGRWPHANRRGLLRLAASGLRSAERVTERLEVLDRNARELHGDERSKQHVSVRADVLGIMLPARNGDRATAEQAPELGTCVVEHPAQEPDLTANEPRGLREQAARERAIQFVDHRDLHLGFSAAGAAMHGNADEHRARKRGIRMVLALRDELVTAVETGVVLDGHGQLAGDGKGQSRRRMRHADRITNTAGTAPVNLNVIAVPISLRVNL